MRDRITILTISRSDTRGGAATVAWNLFSHYLALGLSSWYLVQYKFSSHDRVITIDNESHFSIWRKFIAGGQQFLLRHFGAIKGVWRLTRALDWAADPAGMLRHQLGIEEFNYKGSRMAFSRIKPDVVHAHVLHGGFFDLRYLEKISNKVPVFFTLHDAWMLAGHCAHSFECERWKTGCGHCPDLSIPQAIKRDGSAFNWKRKKDIYTKSRLYVATPCEWLMGKVKQSILAQACIEARVIPNGVNHEIFYPASRSEARAALGLEQDAIIFLFSANGIKKNRWKDFELMKRALALASEQKSTTKIIFLALGEKSDPVEMGSSEIRFMPYCGDPKRVADFYRASDIYLHASKADTFPNAVLEALSCGTPVIGTAVGGIPEQIRGWKGVGFSTEKFNCFGIDKATGVLVEAGNAHSFANAMMQLMNAPDIRATLGRNALADAIDRFPIHKQTNAYLAWYREILAHKN